MRMTVEIKFNLNKNILLCPKEKEDDFVLENNKKQ